MNYDTLDYLIPPVRKRCENDEFGKALNNIRNNIRRPKRFSTKLANHITQLSQDLKADPVTSSSLALKKTNNKGLLEQFSISNFIKKKAVKNNFITTGKKQKCLIPGRNVIKITVVPITTEIQTSKIVLKRIKSVNKIHKTVSNTNTSIKNNILSLSRHQRKKHDIRETSSADLFTPRWERNINHDELYLNPMTHTKAIINSLNMNKKSRQERVSRESHEIQGSPKGTRKNYKTVHEGCICNDAKINNVLNDMNSPKNRVTIVGRLGINENDQYILNCAATVNNKPIEAFTNQQNLSSASIDQFENNDGINKFTRATQADMTMSFTPDKLKNTNVNNKSEQCYCKNAKDVATAISRLKFIETTDRKSPLIVISVYQTKDTVDDIKSLKDLIEINHVRKSPQSDKNQNINYKSMELKVGNTPVQKSDSTPQKRSPSPPFKTADKSKLENRTYRNRSPSPLVKNINSNKVENRSLRSRSRSPPNKTSGKDNSNNKLFQRTSQKSVKSPDRQNRQPRVNKVLSPKDRSTRNPMTINTAQTSKAYPLKNSYGGVKETAAKKNKIKKAIVDSYTQKILKPLKDSDAQTTVGAKPTSNPSSVTINIDGDNEHYRVLFLQDKVNTDLSIRKTLKTQKQKTNDLKDNEKEYSRKNVHVMPKETIPGKNLENLSNQLNNLQAHTGTSGFKIRDSLEMQHWRDDCYGQCKKTISREYEPTIKIMHKTTKKYVNDEDFSAPIKHYRGDQCCIPNPNQRDQEIRDLLGIKKPRSGKSEFVQEVLPELFGQKLHFNLHPEKCVRSSSSKSSQRDCSFNETQNKIHVNDQPKFVSAWTQYEESTINSYKQMILNRNIQVFLQVEQFTKQKPILLSRKQYEKVKKTIKKKASNKISQEKRKLNNSTKCSVVSIGEIRKTRKHHTPNVKMSRIVQAVHSIQRKKHVDEGKDDHEENKPLHAEEKTTKDDVNLTTSPRKAVSSMEIPYASLAHLRHVKFSSSNVKSKPGSLLCLREKDCPSIQTIFKGHKKCATPNLGTSAYSLYTDEEINRSDNEYNLYPHDEKPRKPFLRRLMSCLVMRSNRPSEAILPKQHEQLSTMNSFDSYHINTSLGGIELTSSLYDTSASFYSNHTILPIARMKRGFLSSVRGFLTNFKSR